MGDDVSFVEEIRLSPDDLAPRFIYADYLEDLGDPQGEFIRVQCQLSEMAPGTSGRSDLFNRERELLQEFGNQWLRPFRELGAKGLSVQSFERGLLERLQFSGTDWEASSPQICKIAPALRSLRLRQPLNLGEEETKPTPLPKQITELDLSANQLSEEDWERLGAYLLTDSDVVSLDVSRNRLGPTVLMLGGMFSSVTHLKAGFNNLDGEALSSLMVRMATQLAESHPSNQLVELDLRGNPLGDECHQLLASYKWTKLTHLNLSSCGISSIAPLTSEEHFPELTHLILRDNPITSSTPNDNGTWGDLAPEQSTFLQNLKVLDLRNTPVSTNSHGI